MKKYSTYSDEKLTSAVKSADAAAFKELYYRYYKPLHSFICLRTNSTELAPDFIQEVFTRLWQNRDKLIPENSVKAYLYKIANNLIIDFFRKKNTERTYLAEKSSATILQTDNLLESVSDINFAIQNLPENCRIVFMLSRYQNLTYLEIAKALNISIKTVEARMSQALKILRTELL
ncbi:MAG: RNA polymerase sigma factor [Candidatus Zhuqueibacterota bacterium]